MPIASTDLAIMSAANQPEDDTSTAGGAISTTSRPDLVQFSATAALVVKSDGADVRTGTAVFRLADGTKVTQAFTLNGATEVTVAGGNAERVIRVTLNTTDAARTVSVLQGSGGTVRATIRPNESQTHILFGDSVSESAIAIRYAEEYVKNNHATLALQQAAEKLTGDPAARIRIGLATSKGSTGTLTNRKTAPAGVTFVDDNVSASVPTASLGVGEFIAVYVEQNLPANDPPNKNTLTLETSGAST